MTDLRKSGKKVLESKKKKRTKEEMWNYGKGFEVAIE